MSKVASNVTGSGRSRYVITAYQQKSKCPAFWHAFYIFPFILLEIQSKSVIIPMRLCNQQCGTGTAVSLLLINVSGIAPAGLGPGQPGGGVIDSLSCAGYTLHCLHYTCQRNFAKFHTALSLLKVPFTIENLLRHFPKGAFKHGK